MGYIRNNCQTRRADLLNALGGNSNFLSDEEASYKCVEELERLVKDVGILATHSEFNIPESALESLTQDGEKQKRLLARIPLSLEKEDMIEIIEQLLREE